VYFGANISPLLLIALIININPLQHIPEIWEKEYIIRQDEIEYRGKNKYMVPVNIDIPIDQPLKKYKNSWFLVLKIDSPGINCYSNFHIPIYDIEKYEQ
jgi:hypothetical protein